MNSSTFNSKMYLILIVIIVFLYGIFSFMFEVYKRNYLETNFYGEFQNFSLVGRIDVVNTGTSHGSVSFDWKSQEILNGVNFARSGQPLSYDLFLLGKYTSQIENAIILVPISFHTLCMESSFFSPVDSIYQNTMPFLGLHQTRYSVEFLLNHRDDRLFYDDAYENSDKVVPSYYPSRCDEVILQSNMNYITEISERFSNTNRIVLVTTPYYLPSLGDIDGFERFYKLVYKLVNHLNIEYYDYSRDLRFENVDYFYNRDHLNTEGRKLFTEIFIREALQKSS